MFSKAILAGLITTALSLPLNVRQSSDTSNDLVNGDCRPVTVIFARGTTEPGNIGDSVGPQLQSALNSQLGAGTVAFQGVDYPADVAGFLVGGSPSGGNELARLTNLASTKCPSTQIVLSGYSQGAQVVYKGAAQISSAVGAKVRAAVLFGNPNDGDPVPNIDQAGVRTFCHDGDLICDGSFIVLPPHLNYGPDTPAGAAFIASRVNV